MLFNGIYKNKKVFVTGHTGFKGSWLVTWLCELGAEVAGFSNEVPTNPSLYETLNLEKKIKDFRADIRDNYILKKNLNDFQPEVIFHLAAQPIVSDSFKNPVKTFEVNLMGMVNLLECMRELPKLQAAVLITSDKCYENVEWEYGYREDDRLGGKDPYSASKAAAEIAFGAYVSSFFKTSSISLSTARAGNVIGGGDWAQDRIVPDCMRAWSQQKPVSIRNPHSTRPWQHVLEPLSGYLQLGAQLITNPQNLNHDAFNFGPNHEVNVSVIELLEKLKKHWENVEINTVLNTEFALKEAGLLKLNCDKALARLNWLPTLTLDETTDFTSYWYKTYYNNPNEIKEITKNQIAQYAQKALERKRAWIK
ncbi:MAG: CDP-glucose 4,6-dehydratase [Silvanigrellaceae bacterium]|nr:CDP-glucose 4,6-dehydratase [Silvanigrellaceae bacterium]